eukprot:SAG31_NODE_83_length_27039_cov_14.035746_12_plen_82_part_00
MELHGLIELALGSGAHLYTPVSKDVMLGRAVGRAGGFLGSSRSFATAFENCASCAASDAMIWVSASRDCDEPGPEWRELPV